MEKQFGKEDFKHFERMYSNMYLHIPRRMCVSETHH